MVRKRSGRWYYDFMLSNVRHRGVIPEARTKAQAEQAEVKIRNQIFEGKYGRLAASKKLSDFINDVYLPWARFNKRHPRNDEMHCKVLCKWFGNKTFAQITPFLIEKFKKERRESITRYGKQRSAASVNREIEVLSKVFSLALNSGIIESNPCQKVKKLRLDNQRKRYLTQEEEARLMQALSGRRSHLKPLVMVAIHTGMRRGELLTLKWQNVDFTRGLIYVTNTKTGYDRDVPMNSVVRETLLELQKGSGDYEYVFTNPKTGIGITDVKTGFKAACREAGIVDFRFHDLRHTTGTRLADGGSDAFAIAEVLGHRNLQTTKRYTHATELRKKRAVEILASYSEDLCHNFVTNKKRATS